MHHDAAQFVPFVATTPHITAFQTAPEGLPEVFPHPGP
jgi:hypothetical protein